MSNPSEQHQPPQRDIPASGEYRPPEHVQGAWIFEDQINANIRGTFWLMIAFILFLTAVVWAAGELYAPKYAYLLAGAAALVTFFTSYFSYFNSEQLVLSLSHARPASKEEFPFLINTLEGLTLAAGLPAVPRAFVIDDPAPNAFATGRDPNHAAIAVTTGLLHRLNRYQLEGVLAHEMSHIGNRDFCSPLSPR